MGTITSQSVFDLVLAFGYAMGIYLLVSSFRRQPQGTRIGGVLIIPALAGLATLIGITLLGLSSSTTLWRLQIAGQNVLWSLALGLGALVAGAFIGDMLVNRLGLIFPAAIAGTVRKLVRRSLPDIWPITSGQSIALFGPMLFLLLFAYTIRPEPVALLPSTNVGGGMIQDRVYRLEGSPLSMVFYGESTAFIGFNEGRIASFQVPQSLEEDIVLQTVTEEVFVPRGLAILNDVLFVTDQGPPPEVRNPDLLSTNGRVLAFDILPGGQLGEGRVIVSDLPVGGVWHGINGIAVGPDEKLYVVLGNRKLAGQLPEFHLLGTVVRFAPDGSEFEVFARGLRNIYDLEFDNRGRLFGSDNDGPSVRGFRRESVYQIKEGADYGFPWEGTYDVPLIRTDDPIWTLDDASSGSSGIEWAERVGLDPGLLIGGTHLLYLPITEDETGMYIPAESDIQPAEVLFDRQGFMTVVEAGPKGRLWVAVFGFRETSDLYLFRFQDAP
ncbi:MAG: PQQ-dependent sugar dehydrogenase [Dehalococcoidia bacterium]